MANESKTLLTQLQEAQASLASQAELIKAKDAELAKAGESVAALTAQRDEAVKAKGEADAALKAEADAHAKTQGELADAKAKLANPAFADASATGSAGAGHEGGAEAGAVAFDSKAEALDAYNKLTDAKAKAEFRQTHRAVLGL